MKLGTNVPMGPLGRIPPIHFSFILFYFIFNESVQHFTSISSKSKEKKNLYVLYYLYIIPKALADFIGLDTCLAIMRVLHTQLGDSKYRPAPLLIKYVDAGWLGKISRFYT